MKVTIRFKLPHIFHRWQYSLREVSGFNCLWQNISRECQVRRCRTCGTEQVDVNGYWE